MIISPEIGLILAPDRTYAALAARATPMGAVRALRRPLLAAVVLGVSMALSSTRHVTPELAATTTILLSVCIVIQIGIALAVIAGPAIGTIGRARAVDLFFASHAPWSFWLLLCAAWVPSPLGRSAAPVEIAAVVPIVLTPRIIAAYFREVAGLDRRRAAIRTLVHQILTWGAFVALFGAAVAILPRILQVLR